jgi:DNA-3-methyladenine glycosylase
MPIRPRTDTAELVTADVELSPLTHEFFARPALVVARALIGKCLVRELDGGERVVWPITETEAYIGAHDLACHGRFGETARTAVMFGPAGQWYVYFIYGMYWMLNVVTNTPGVPAAVLIRAAGPANGPGKLTKRLGITRAENGLVVDPASKLWLTDAGLRVPRKELVRTPRIGVDYAGEWREKLYRFVWKKA